jgi:hypothetical protein
MFDDLTNPVVAYVVGLLQTDGHHDGDLDGKGKVTIELAARDAAVLTQIRDLLPCYSSVRYRTRTTNFSRRDYVTATLSFFDQDTRRALVGAGVPIGRKSAIIKPPSVPFSEPDYVRGLLDGDGSVGFTGAGIPFVSIVSASPELAAYLCQVIFEVCGVRRTSKPNARDRVCNLMVANLAAATLAAWAWHSPDVLGIERKRKSALEVGSWRPDPRKAGRYGVEKRRWTAADDQVLQSRSLADAAEALGRTLASVSVRRWRLERDARGSATDGGEHPLQESNLRPPRS